MKIKTIDRVVRKKLNEWIETLPRQLQKPVKESVILTGGSIASMLLGEDVNDYDVYFSSQAVCADVARHYANNRWEVLTESVTFSDDEDSPEGLTLRDGQVYNFIQSDGFQKFDANGDAPFQLAYVTCNAITLTDDMQIVTRFTGPADEIHKNYDFVHATNYFTFADGVVTNKAALESLLSRELIYMGSRYPLCSIIRTRKFIQRKWTVNAAQYLKMVLQLHELNLMDPAVLREQLVGVDSAYFNWFLHAYEKDRADGTKTMTTGYLCELVDRVFSRDIDGIED